jgi:hypothetical protein
MAERWRIEADEEWLAAHRSDNFARLRRRMNRLGGFGSAVSMAELGPYGGAPRNPVLKIGGKGYAVVRYAQHRIAYTAVRIDPQRCRRCDRRLVEVHRVSFVAADGIRSAVGAVRVCRRCETESWLFHSGMPAVRRARVRSRKVVL